MRVRTSVEAMPPIIGRAMRRITSLPNPSVRKIGARPAKIVVTVINFGRTRMAAPLLTAANRPGKSSGLALRVAVTRFRT